ncbi:MAG TPA: ATP-binding protein, partial [Opitutaceae bacterium]
MERIPASDRSTVMDIDLQRILEGKRGYRKQLAALPVEEKAKILEKLRARAQAAKPGRKQWSRPAIIPAVPRTRNVRKQTSSGSRFGGRATATGVGYEVRIASWIAVKMLAGDAATWWAGLDGASIEAITMQAPSEVDDIVVDVRGNEVNRMFVCAKDRSSSIALTDKSAVFAESITSLVRQHLALSAAERSSVRLVWAVPSSVGRAVTRDLLAALDIHRSDCDYGTWEEFLAHRRVPERKVLRAIAAAAETAWQKVTETTPNETSLRAFLATVSVEVLDFDSGSRDERQAETELRSHVAATPADAPAIWLAVEQCMGSANQVGNRITPASLRREIEQRGLKLRPSAGYAADMSLLQEVTRANLDRLREHTELCFGPSASDLVHIKREAEHDALIGAAKQGHLLLTGDPGSGKSGMIHGLAQALLVESLPVVLLLAEDVTDRDRKGAANLPGLTHPMAEVLANWPDGAKGYLITDALDAVRDGEILERLRRLLVDVKQGGGSWTVVASVREYDLKHGSRLRESFPGAGVPGFASNDFAQVAHFHLPALTDLQLDTLGSARSEIRTFIERARQDGRSQETHRSPFYLRLAAHLLRDGVNRHRVADWNSPAVLLQKCWHHRIESDAGGDERTVALKAICGPMV